MGHLTIPVAAESPCTHERRFVVVDLHHAPVPNGHHTHVMVFACSECARAWCWPPDNYALVETAFVDALRTVLQASGVELVGAVPVNGQRS